METDRKGRFGFFWSGNGGDLDASGQNVAGSHMMIPFLFSAGISAFIGQSVRAALNLYNVDLTTLPLPSLTMTTELDHLT